jgi:hypothetical protein
LFTGVATGAHEARAAVTLTLECGHFTGQTQRGRGLL